MSDFDLLMQNMSQTTGMLGQRQENANAPAWNIKTETGPEGQALATIKMPMQDALGIQQKMTYLEQALQAMTQEANRLQAQEQRTRQHPLIAALSTVAGELAQDRRLPPAVSALGRASLALNPPPDVLGARRMGLEEQIGRTSALGAEVGLRAKSLDIQQSRYEAGLEQKKTEDRNKIFRDLTDSAEKGVLSNGPLTAKVLKDAGMDEAQAKTMADELVAISKEKNRLVQEAAASTDARAQAAIAARERASDKRLAMMMTAMQPKLQEKAELDKGIEEAAQALAPMNKQSLSRMNQISSMFGAGRLRIFARARELNPKFNTEQLDRMAAMEKSFTVGKDGQGLQSFDTFLQHAGEVTKTIQKIEQSRSPAINKPMSWWRKNMAGSPEFQSFIVSLEPVGKEFESFLLNQRALYVDDRKQIQVLMNENSSPKQIAAALKQMGKTAKDRYSAMNQRYKRQMGTNIEDPFSPEAHDAAQRIGIDLPVDQDTADPLGVLK